MLRILLADDHGLVRKGIRLLLERGGEMEVVGEAADGREAVRLADDLGPDIIIMDITMPQWNGIDDAARIVKRHPAVGVMILSMHADEAFVLRALSAGAKAYLLKDSAEADLREAVRAVAQGRLFLSPEIARKFQQEHIREPRDRRPRSCCTRFVRR